jgi:hypothetical protein
MIGRPARSARRDFFLQSCQAGRGNRTGVSDEAAGAVAVSPGFRRPRVQL